MKLKILEIEDNDINMDLMIFVLDAFALAVIPALNGPAGLAIAKSEVPDLIF
jgi:two-component system cell cycle response regulator DivK